jgi:hypothetical protein
MATTCQCTRTSRTRTSQQAAQPHSYRVQRRTTTPAHHPAHYVASACPLSLQPGASTVLMPRIVACQAMHAPMQTCPVRLHHRVGGVVSTPLRWQHSTTCWRHAPHLRQVAVTAAAPLWRPSNIWLHSAQRAQCSACTSCRSEVVHCSTSPTTSQPHSQTCTKRPGIRAAWLTAHPPNRFTGHHEPLSVL